MTEELYAPLLERDLVAISRAARAYAAAHSSEALWIAVARFAVLAHAPAQHAKRAVLACRATHALRAELGQRWLDAIIECACYAAQSRLPWSEPPIFEEASNQSLDDIRAEGDALLILDAARALLPILGEKGLPALQHMVFAELPMAESAELPAEEAAGELDPSGSPDSVQLVFWRVAAAPERRAFTACPLEPYPLARDYAQTLLAHFYARRLPDEEAAALLAAVHHNLAHGESYADFSFA
ncbi:MAG TPA: hypothetical protein VHW00_25415 [Thermoanaerobaculia bacterium]|nr:hypothetical protein [Thermoanaerobaculia bacterium]